MTTQLPVRIEFQLPDGWRPAPPDEVGAPGAAFVALHPDPDPDFTANITISGAYRPDEASLAEIADESVHRLEQSVGQVRLRNRAEVGTEDAPGLTQALDLSTVINDHQRDLVQCQVYLAMKDIDEPSKRAVIELALTSTPGQFGDVIADFQQFVRSVRPPTEPVSTGGRHRAE
jgi:hypothetical protein